MIDLDGDGNSEVVLRDCQAGLTRCDVFVLTSSFMRIATDVTILQAFPISRGHTPAIGAFLFWDTDSDGRPDGGAILIDVNGDGDFGEPHEIRLFGGD